MGIQVRGASTNNLKEVSVDIGDGLTVVTGVSGSGKTSLVFDTLYHEARRRYLDVFSRGSSTARLPPAEVRSITGVGPSIAVGQNLLNRNPNSTLATASGLHPFLRLLFAHFGLRTCPTCDTPLNVLSEDAIVEHLVRESKRSAFEACAPIVRNAVGSHSTLLGLLAKQFGKESILVDSIEWNGEKLNASETHHIDLKLDTVKKALKKGESRRIVDLAKSLGGGALRIKREKSESIYSWNQACVECGHWLRPVESVEFKNKCPHCEGKGCGNCQHTGLTPETTRIKWQGLAFSEILSLSVRDAHSLFKGADITRETKRLHFEILRRLDSLMTVGLDYIQLNRPSPSLSRGESQRVRLAIALTSELEDILHILDEPTIGQHYEDTAALLPAFLKLRGPVVFVEHDKLAASFADHAIDIGPGAGEAGGEIVFEGTPGELWDSETHTGTYFSRRNRVHIPEKRDPPLEFLKIVGAKEHNLKSISVEIPIGRFTVITGISGSGKSTLVEHVLVPSLKEGKPVQCSKIVGPLLKPVFVDQSPIGKNPRSNPATYTKLSDTIRDLFASETSLTPSHFSFNRPEGACPSCKGMGAIEVKMRYIPSTWITCSECEGLRYSEEVLAAKVNFGGLQCNIADIYEMSIAEVQRLLTADDRITRAKRMSAERMLEALVTIGLGYLKLGQTSPSLSGGEAERIKLSKYLGKNSLKGQLIILDEPSTGLHPKDLSGLLAVIDRLVQSGATIVVVEHNTDIIRAADWVVDLGPGAGPRGGEVVYAGLFKDLLKSTSLTAKALLEEERVNPRTRPRARSAVAPSISIKKASANNLRDVSVDIPKGKITVVTGPSGSGKSSLVRDVLEAEAQRRFLETLSMYERQSVKEGPEAPVESVTGLGVAVSVTPQRSRYMLRTTVGTVTEISKHLAVLLSLVGVRTCLTCKSKMTRGQKWTCPSCGEEAPLAKARHFSSRTYSAACVHCHGVGSFQVPQPEKLIVAPDKPLCAGAMYSPGFFPKGYLCKPYNGGYYIVKAIGVRHGFDPAKTPWNEMTRTAQEAFLHGDPTPIQVTFESRTQKPHTRAIRYPGFYGWIRDWDVGGAYTRTAACSHCDGTGFRPEIRAITLSGYSIDQLSEVPFTELERIMKKLKIPKALVDLAGPAHDAILRRIAFLEKVGLGYLHLNRVAGTLSAGEAQRAKLAGLLGSGLTSLTVLLDEPTRGMHPSEVQALVDALRDLKNEGNSIVIVEHDPEVIKAAEHIIDMGPKAGSGGGLVVAEGTLKEISKKNTVTSKWLSGRRVTKIPENRREPQEWLEIRGAKENNLSGEIVRIPLGTVVGICGPSGSGKSTLLVDTIGRALSPKKITTSVAYEPIAPGEHKSIVGAPQKTIVLDQSRRGINNPGQFLDVFTHLTRIYSESEDAAALGITSKELSSSCSSCEGRGLIRTEMGFLPTVFSSCDTCKGTGLRPEAWEVHVNGIPYPKLGELTIDEAYDLFGEDEGLRRILSIAQSVGLGYLVLHQPSHTISGGEIQRLRIAKELSRKAAGPTLYIWDEPSLGQHMEDVARLVDVLRGIAEKGHSVVIIEHHPHILAACDWLIELGPGGGPEGGRIVAEGTPETIAAGNSRTAVYIRETLEGRL